MINKKTNSQIIDRISKVFKALSEPIRIKILQELEEEKSVSELCGAIGTSQPNLSKHLKILSELKLLSRRQEGNSVYYSIADPMIEKLCDLVCRGIEKQLGSEIRKLNSAHHSLKAGSKILRSRS